MLKTNPAECNTSTIPLATDCLSKRPFSSVNAQVSFSFRPSLIPSRLLSHIRGRKVSQTSTSTTKGTFPLVHPKPASLVIESRETIGNEKDPGLQEIRGKISEAKENIGYKLRFLKNLPRLFVVCNSLFYVILSNYQLNINSGC